MTKKFDSIRPLTPAARMPPSLMAMLPTPAAVLMPTVTRPWSNAIHPMS
ncbi:hypothetical protein [Glacieibacterium frigidum]|nr:hypothetical protein [Glacieibacterium frigidum]